MPLEYFLNIINRQKWGKNSILRDIQNNPNYLKTIQLLCKEESMGSHRFQVQET